MLITASSKFIRTSPRKLRLVADAVRHLSPDEALIQLKNLNKRGAVPIAKTLKQAVANAVNNFNLPKDELKLKSLIVDEGPTYKRFQPVSRGRAHSIYKRTSHVKVVLESKGKHGTKS
ncbi:MAG TPA: 50S ribosomal protein L22 [Patescibacteria group bacterium]|nr:50S ribosomal protein L22 [Patescibacteria group bacterium]